MKHDNVESQLPASVHLRLTVSMHIPGTAGSKGTRGNIWQREQNHIAVEEIRVLGAPLDPKVAFLICWVDK